MAKLRFPAEDEILSRATVRLVVDPAEANPFDARIQTDHSLKLGSFAEFWYFELFSLEHVAHIRS